MFNADEADINWYTDMVESGRNKDRMLVEVCKVLPQQVNDSVSHSARVKSNFQKISRLLGMSFFGFEDRVMELMEEMEARNGSDHQNGMLAMKGKKKPGNSCSRELKRLHSNIKYDCRKRIEKRGEGNGLTN